MNKDVAETHLTPFQLGYRLPAEWEPHEATWLAWPHNEETWPGKLREVEEIYLQMIEFLLSGEKVRLLVNDERERDRAARQLARRGVSARNLIYYLIPTVDAWIRDYGLIFIKKSIVHSQKSIEKRKKNTIDYRLSTMDQQDVAFTKWRFNAWGGKYESLARDEGVGEELAPLLGLPLFRPERVLEGGSIDTNGLGSCLVTEQCLLNPNRNPSLSRFEIEKSLRDFLGITNFIWLGEGIEGDDTDGHIDDIARFVNWETVVAAVEPDPSDPNERPLRENLRRLRGSSDSEGRKLTVAEIPMPDPVAASGGRLPASYLNFYIANGAVLVPIFGQAKDQTALKILGELFPKRNVVGIRCEDLVLGLGALHCVTHEEPLRQ